MTTTPLRECDKCEGAGWTPSARVTGAEMRALRQSWGLSCAKVGRAMDPPVTRAYVSQLELGDGRWTPDLVKRYVAAVERVAAQDVAQAKR